MYKYAQPLNTTLDIQGSDYLEIKEYFSKLEDYYSSLLF